MRKGICSNLKISVNANTYSINLNYFITTFQFVMHNKTSVAGS